MDHDEYSNDRYLIWAHRILLARTAFNADAERDTFAEIDASSNVCARCLFLAALSIAEQALEDRYTGPPPPDAGPLCVGVVDTDAVTAWAQNALFDELDRIEHDL